MKENKFRSLVRKLIREEVNPSEREDITEQLCSSVSDTLDEVLTENSVHTKGLSPQQAASLYRELARCIDQKLAEFTSKKRPEKFKGYQEYIERFDL